jgi:hypothetical protein
MGGFHLPRIILLLTLLITTLLSASCSKQTNILSAYDAPSASAPLETYITIQETNDPAALPANTDETAFNDPKYDEEKQISDLFHQEEIDKEDEKEILRLLSDINWCDYYKLTDGDYQLIEWLNTLDITDSDALLSLLNATNGLDGAMADGFAGILADLLEKNPSTFISCLAQLTDSKADIILNLLRYDLSYDEQGKTVISKLNELLTKDLPEKETAICRKLIQEIEIRN